MSSLRLLAKEILLDRLGLEDCLCDALDCEPDATFDAAVTEVQAAITAWDFSALSKLARDIVVDCATGSTYFANVDAYLEDHVITRYRYRRLHEAGDLIEAVLAVKVPRG